MNVRAHMSMLFHLDKCIGCHTCSVACKNLWTDRKGAEYMWWNNVETRPGTGYPTQWENQEHYHGGWELKDGKLRLRLHSKLGGLMKLFYNPSLPTLDDYYEPFTFRYQDLFNAPAGDDQPTAIPISLITGEPIEIQTGPNWDDDLGGSNIYARNDPNLDGSARDGPRADGRAGAGGVQLPAAHLQPLPQPGLRGGLPLRRDLQARRGRGGAGQREQVPGLAHVRGRLPLQEGLLQLVDRQVGKVHPVLPAPGDRPGPGLRPLLRRAHPLHGRAALRRRPDPRRRHGARRAAGRGAPRGDPGPVRPGGDRRGARQRHRGELDQRRAELAGLQVRQRVGAGPAAAPRIPHHGDDVLHPAALAGGQRDRGRPVQAGRRPDERDFELFDRLDAARMPVQYLANLFSAGNEAPIRSALRKLLAVRTYMRRKTVDGAVDEKTLALLAEAGTNPAEVEAIYRLTTLPTLAERFVIPQYHREMAVEAWKDPLAHKGETGFGYVQPPARGE